VTSAKERKTKSKSKEKSKAKPKPRSIPLSERIDDPEILEVLRQPVGSPINLTEEQKLKVLLAGMGSRPDLPTGEEYVRRVRAKWGIKVRG